MWLFLFLLAGAWIFHQYFVVNTTPSFPRGLYWKTHEPWKKGDLILFCPPNIPIFHEALQHRYLAHGLCPAGTGYMIKRLVGVTGDFVTITEKEVSINGQALPMSARRIYLKNGVDSLTKVLRAEEVLLMSPHPLSFDGRYIGPLTAQCLESPLIPVFTWEE